MPHLSEFSAGPENSHGARSVHGPHAQGSPSTAAGNRTVADPRRCERRQRDNQRCVWSRARTLGSRIERQLRPLSGCMCRATRRGWRLHCDFGGRGSRPTSAHARRRRRGFGSRSRARVCLSGRGSETRTPTLERSRPEYDSPREMRTAHKIEVKSAQPRRTGTQPDQAESAALMRALTAPMSVRPAAFAFTMAMTLPMSFTDAAPVDAMASLIKASTSASESCAGR